MRSMSPFLPSGMKVSAGALVVKASIARLPRITPLSQVRPGP